jgi:hypothetical protein
VETSRAAALEVTRIHSVAGLLPGDRPWLTVPPFRAPHHSASTAAIVGGGAAPPPGEASLAQAVLASSALAANRHLASRSARPRRGRRPVARESIFVAAEAKQGALLSHSQYVLANRH